MQNHSDAAQVLIIRRMGLQKYDPTWVAMRQFTDQRNDETPDECWLLEHYPVYTQGQNGKAENILSAGDIPIVQSDRGGQVTYHGPGQLMVYTLIDLKRKKLHVRQFVTCLEEILIELLSDHQIAAYAKPSAPGVYVNDQGEEKKIGSIGLRVRKGSSYHGIAFNVRMDLSPFQKINPCGFASLQMTQFSDLGGLSSVDETGEKLIAYLIKKLRYTSAHYFDKSEQVDGKQTTE